MTTPSLAPLQPDTLPVWDQDAALSALGNDLNLAHSLLAQLQGELPATRAALQSAAAAGDWTTVADSAHRCAGGAAYCGVLALIGALHRLERAARGDGGGPAHLALAAALHEIERVCAFCPSAP